jgi:hypothetical protein
MWFYLAILVVMFLMTKTRKEYFDFIMKPELNSGDKILLKTRSGRYLTACNNCYSETENENHCKYVLCLRDHPYNTSIFTLYKHPDYRWSFQSQYGGWLKRCLKCYQGCDNAICADGKNKNIRSLKFHIIKNPDSTIKLKADNGRFVQSCPCNQTCGKIMCSSGLGGEVDYQVEFIKVVPEPPRELRFKPQWQQSSVPKGVLLSNVQ